MTGVPGRSIEGQLAFVESLITPEVREEILASDVHGSACAENGSDGFGPIESEILYAFVRTVQPKNIVQIGCGVSTAVCLDAAAKSNYTPRIVCIDPYPCKYLWHCNERGVIELIPSRVQNIDAWIVESLGSNDLLFIDSTHTLGPAGEVSRLILELMPKVAKNVYIHFHDIYFPYDYAPGILNGSLFFHHESSLLHAFLTFNDCFKLVSSLSMLHHEKQHELGVLLKHYIPSSNIDGVETTPGHFPSSTYIRRVRDARD